jgi:DNA-binding NarL/FixJ family response regulator
MSVPSISVILVDHNQILLSGLAALIRSQTDMRLVGTGRSARDAIALHSEHRPDFTIIDLDLPDSPAIYAIQQILLADPGAKLIGLTTYELGRVGREAQSAGVLGVIPKDRIEEDLVVFIRAHVTRRG